MYLDWEVQQLVELEKKSENGLLCVRKNLNVEGDFIFVVIALGN